MTPLRLAARAVAITFALLTCAYAVLAYDPFTLTQVIRFGLFPGLGPFARAHAALHVAAQAAALLSIAPALRGGPGRHLARAYAAAAAIGSAALLWRPLLPGLGSDLRALTVAFGALVPVAWLAAIDLRVWACAPAAGAPDGALDAGARCVRSALAAGALVFLAFSALAIERGARSPAVLGYALALHAMCAVAIAAALLLATSPRARWAQLAANASLFALAVASVARRALLAIAFPGLAGAPLAAAAGGVLALALVGITVRLTGGEGAPPLVLLARPLALPRGWPRALRVGVPLAASVAIAAAGARYDWSFLLQQSAAFGAWVLTLAALLTEAPPELDRQARLAEAARAARRRMALIAAALAAAGAGRAFASAAAVSDGIAGWLARDPALRLLAPAPASAAPAQDFFALLSEHTNLAPGSAGPPLEVELGGSTPRATAGKKPDVIVLVVDSLRRDYLPPYAPPAAAFAPAVAAFARDAVVFRNAFTRYGGTGLSEPSIWVGGMMPHAQYVTPFAPMNALDKLLRAEGFRELVSVDEILDVVLPPSPDRVRLDAAVANKDYALCRTLGELRERLEGLDRARPAFAYTQPQDQHVSRIEREGASVPPGATFPPGFHPPVAARVQRWDACFGEFVRWLDASGRGADAIVVLTSDHGDSLGEEGRWGHAYTLYPEIVRVPLLVRFPAAWRPRVRCRPEALAFTADLAPTLYALLGHPVAERPPFGAPLCALDAEPPPRHEGPQLLASSYGPVYGLLDRGGTRLFVADAVGYSEEVFSLGEGPPERVAVTGGERAAAERAIAERIRRIEEAYGVGKR